MSKSPEQIIQILHSIKDVRLDKDRAIEVKFDDTSKKTFPSGWEPGAGYNGFTQQLLLLIEASLNGELK